MIPAIPSTSILLLQETLADVELIRQALGLADGTFRLNRVQHVPITLARLAGGGVDLVLLDFSCSQSPRTETLAILRKVHGEAPQVPIIVLCRREDNELAQRMIREGASDCVFKEHLATALGPAVRAALEKLRSGSTAQRIEMPRKSGKVIAFMGAKGGVGTTTVALNVASVLARRSQVIIVELRSTHGTLPFYFSPPARTLTIAHLLARESLAINSVDAEACLWAFDSIPGLWLLFGPRPTEQCREIGPADVKAILAALSKLADYVIVDISPCLGEANREVLANSDQLALVVERDSICVQSAKSILDSIGMRKPGLQAAGTIVVNRVALAVPIPLPEIESELGIRTLKVIPPAPDLCNTAQNSGSPVVVLAPESLLATSLAALAEQIASNPVRPRSAGNRTITAAPVESAPELSKIRVRTPKRVPQEMVLRYLARCRHDLATLKSALAGHDYKFARNFGHQMKGTGGAFGFRQLTEVGGLIERAAEDQNVDELRVQVGALEAYLGRVEVTPEQDTA